MSLFQVRTVAAGLAFLAVGVSSAGRPALAQSVSPVRFGDEADMSAASASGDEQRLDAVFFEVTTPGVDADVVVPRDVVVELCGDLDGCTLRLHMIEFAPTNTAKIDGRFFSIRDEDFWTVDSSGADDPKSGYLSFEPDDLVFALSSLECRFKEDTGVNPLGVAYRRFVLIAIDTNVNPYDRRCVLRIDD